MRLRKGVITCVLALWASTLSAAPLDKITASLRPSCIDKKPFVLIITEAAADDDCSNAGGGTFEVVCACVDGVYYALTPPGTGGGGAGDVYKTMNAPSGTDPVASGASDILNFTASGPLTITGDSTTDTLAFAVVEAQLLFKTIDAPAGTDPVADTITDTLALATGAAALSITGDSTTDTVTLDISGTASRCARFDGSGELVPASADCTAGDTDTTGLTHPQVMSRVSLRF